MKPAEELTRSFVYAVESSENYVDTRVRIYNNLRRKTSMSILQDPDSVECAIKRAHLQTFTCLRCCEQNIKTLIQKNLGGN